MRIKLLHIILLILACTFFACKEEDPIMISPVPEISLLSLNPSQVVEFRDSLVFTFEYTDGDGDLGSNESGVKNLFITDNRISVTHEFRIQQLAPTGANIPITGTFTATLPNLIITDNSMQQTVNFDIVVTDRAGNASEPVLSPDVTVVKQ